MNQRSLFEPQEHSQRMRETSEQAFREIKASGELSRQRMAVFELLVKHGPLTGRELDRLQRAAGETGADYHKRLSELKRLGYAKDVRKRPCRVTGKMAWEWVATFDGAPQATAQRPSRADVKRFVEVVQWAAEMTDDPDDLEIVENVFRWLLDKGLAK